MSLASAAAVDPPNDRAAGNRPSNQPAIGSRKNNANDFYFGKIIGEGINLIQSKYYAITYLGTCLFSCIV